MTERFTVLGASGHIGGRLVRHLRAAGHEVDAPSRGQSLPAGDLGHVVYAIGLTADFRRRPFDTMEAHVALLGQLLRRLRFRSFLYLSSTRVYGGGEGGSEFDRLSADPTDPSDLYNLSKLAGEALCHACGRVGVRVARLSNVYDTGCGGRQGATDFLPSVVADAASGEIVFATAAESAKDYVRIDDVCRALERIALAGTARCYNVASGHNVSNGEIATALARLTGCATGFIPAAPAYIFPRIDTARIASLFAQAADHWRPARLVDDLPRLVATRTGRSAA